MKKAKNEDMAELFYKNKKEPENLKPQSTPVTQSATKTVIVPRKEDVPTTEMVDKEKTVSRAKI